MESRAEYAEDINAARGELQALDDAALSVGALGPGWSSAKHGFHGQYSPYFCINMQLDNNSLTILFSNCLAISTVLNHPTKRAAPPKAHSTLPSVVPADLPRVRRKDFDPYLNDIGPQWNAFKRMVAQSTRQRQESLSRVHEETKLSSGRPGSPISPSNSLSSVQTTKPPTQSRAIASLDTVPDIFFDPDFSLVDPVTFALVTEQSMSSGSLEQDPASISYSVPLLEKLSHYADTVESHLVREIQDRSASFFSALTNLHDLQSESERCLRRIGELKTMLTQVDEEGARKGLELVREDMKVTRLMRLEDGVKLVKGVHDMRTIAQGLAGAGEWSDALNIVENLQALSESTSQTAEEVQETKRQYHSPIAEEEENKLELPTLLPTSSGTSITSKLPASLRDISLRKLQAFTSLPDDLRTLTTQIASTLSDDFAAISRQDLILRVDESKSRQFQEHAQEDEQALRERLAPVLSGLLRTGGNGLKEAMEKWREVLMADVRSAVKKVPTSHPTVAPKLRAFQHTDLLTHEPEEIDANPKDPQSEPLAMPTQEKTLPDKPLSAKANSLVQALIALNYEDFLDLMRRIYASLLISLHGAKSQSQVISSIINGLSLKR